MFCVSMVWFKYRGDLMEYTCVLNVHAFGEFQIVNEEGQLNLTMLKSKRLAKLLFYFITHHNAIISSSDLCDYLWENDEISNPIGALKNLVYRLRTVMKQIWPDQELIMTGSGTYYWNSQVKLIVDFEEFYDLVVVANEIIEDRVKIDHYKRATEIYRDRLFAQFDYDSLIMQNSIYYHNVFLKMTKEFLKVLYKQKLYDDLYFYSNNALTLDNTEEDFYRYEILALGQNREFELARVKYETAKYVLNHELGVMPSEKLMTTYQQIISQYLPESETIDKVKQDIEPLHSKEVLVCDYGAFKNLCNLEIRLARRHQFDSTLLLVTINMMQPMDPHSRQYRETLPKGMDYLEEVLIDILRNSDSISKVSPNQYSCLLSMCNLEDANLVIKRIEKYFYRNLKKNDIYITCSNRKLGSD